MPKVFKNFKRHNAPLQGGATAKLMLSYAELDLGNSLITGGKSQRARFVEAD